MVILSGPHQSSPVHSPEKGQTQDTVALYEQYSALSPSPLPLGLVHHDMDGVGGGGWLLPRDVNGRLFC